MAKLYFRYGAMNSGKSTLLLQTAHNYEERGMKIIIIKPSCDTKSENRISSRLGAEREVEVLLKSNEDIYKIIEEKYKNISCILVDEAQFLTKEQVDQLLKITVYLDIPVIAYGLRTDFKTNGFTGSTRLLEIAHTIEEMKTICRCGKKAMFNARFINGQMVTEGNQIAIDNSQEITYESMCPKCYYKKLERK